MKENNLKCIMMAFTDGPNDPGFTGPGQEPLSGFPTPGPSVDHHIASLESQARAALQCKSSLIKSTNLSPVIAVDPIFINVHGGNDYFTADMGHEYFTRVLEVQKKLGW